MIKTYFKSLILLIVVASMGVVSTSCSKDNDDDSEPTVSSVDNIVGTYIGDLNMVGLSDSAAERAYVELTRKSTTSVRCKIESEGWGVDMEPVNLSVTFNGNIATLKSETSKSISGQVINKNLQITYETAVGVFQFLGKLD